MTTHAVLVQNRVAATNVDAYNRSAISSGCSIDNGMVFRLDSQSGSASGAAEVWVVTPPSASSTTLNHLWMAYSPEIVVTNAQYKGLDPDPRNFYNVAGTVFDAFKPQPGDIVTITGDAFTGSAASAYATVSELAYTMLWGSTVSTSALCLKYLETTYVSIAGSAIGTQRVTAYKFEVLTN